MTLWADLADPAFASHIRRRLPDAQLKGAADPLRVNAVTRVLHYPAYVLAQIDYFRAHAPSTGEPDLIPPELVLTAPVRAAYEQVLLGRATGILRLREDGHVVRASSNSVVGESHLRAAERLLTAEGTRLREELQGELEPRLTIAADVERDLRELLDAQLTPIDRNVLHGLLRRYGL
jgi:hypothetical protein